MNCNHCTNNLHPTTSYSVCTRANCGCNSFSAGPVVCTPFRDSCEHEPEAPILSLGSRVLWPTEFQHVLGTIRWIGRIPQLSPDWAAGVEFDEPVCNGGNGIFHGRRYFFCPNGHALFLPISDLINNDEVQADSPIPRNECNVSCGCSHTCHNNNSYQYISRPRDATYGHFRHNCYPLCSKDDYQLNGRCCEHIPIYGKISSRRPLCHEDHPYESYITRPVADNVPERKVSDHNYEDAGQNYSLAVDAVHTHSPSCCTEYSTTPRFKEDKGAKSKITPSLHHSKPVARHEQPVMASLYIEDKSSHHGPIPFLVTPSMSVKKLKKKVQKQYKFPKELQCWVLGETFAIQDDSSLASYGVTETGCPILLYVMATESKCRSLPNHPSRRPVKHPIYDDVALTSSDSESDSVSNRSSRKGSLFDSDSDHKTSEIGAQILAARNKSPKPHISHNTNHIPKTSHDKSATAAQKRPPRHPRVKKEKHRIKQEKSGETGGNSKSGLDKNKDYHALVQLDDVDLVTNVEPFECAVCFLDIEAGEGVVLQECLHTFCKECLASAIQFCETALIKCPFRNDEYSCESHLLEREIKSLVTPEVFERHLQRSMALAESQALDSFHCKTPDCPGWCLFEDNVNIFLCPVCKHTNCLTCAAIHEGKNCRQYQDDVAFRCDSSEEAKKTKEYLEDMLKNGDAMKCPKCQVILMKKWGCDWLKCSMCHTEVCWVTKGPRWGPEGRGDTSGGCKCMVNGVRCHPKCNYCH